MPVVVDTNVLVVANQASDNASIDCIEACVNALSQLKNDGIVAVDDKNLILDEYRRRASLAGQPGLGDAFLRHVYDNLYNVLMCIQISVTVQHDEKILEFPSDNRLKGFDKDDQKFVAVSLGCDPHAVILNAVDNDWWDYRDVFRDMGVPVTFLCPQHMGRNR